MWKKMGFVLLVLLVILLVKLIWFPSSFNRGEALNTAHWSLEKASEKLHFDLSRFGKPDYVSGNDKNGYLITWYFNSEDGKKKLDVIVSVSPLDEDFSGSPFVLDCRPGHDQDVRQGGFSYLCRP